MNSHGKSLLYKAPVRAVNVDVFFQDETVWLTQKTLAELFGLQVPAIANHLKNLFESEELLEDSVISKMGITAADEKSYLSNFDMDVKRIAGKQKS